MGSNVLSSGWQKQKRSVHRTDSKEQAARMNMTYNQEEFLSLDSLWKLRIGLTKNKNIGAHIGVRT